jgi:TRAP-type C4-dicarboxylate transport system permease small subunit
MANLLDAAEAGVDRINRLLIGVVAVSIGLFAVMIPVNLILVKMQLGGIWWLHEAIEYALYVGVFIGAPWVLRQGAHVRVDVINLALPPRAAMWLERLIDCVGVVLCLCLFSYGLRAALWEFGNGTLPDKDLRIPNWCMLSVFAVSFLLLAIEFLFRLRRARAAGETPPDPTQAAF